jgi:DNA-binding response OmpR family regulator
MSYHSLVRALEREGYRVIGARTGEQALQLVESERPALVSLDIVLPGMAGWDILKELKSRATTRDIPVVIVTVLENRELGLALGADDFFTKPVERAAFVRRVRELAPRAAAAGGAPSILVIDDDEAVHDMLEAELEPNGYRVLRATTGPSGLELARAHRPAVVVLDLMMPGMNGFEVAYELRADQRTARLPIVVLTAKDLSAADRDALSGRIATLIPKGGDAVSRVTDAIRDLLARR